MWALESDSLGGTPAPAFPCDLGRISEPLRAFVVSSARGEIQYQSHVYMIFQGLNDLLHVKSLEQSLPQ